MARKKKKIGKMTAQEQRRAKVLKVALIIVIGFLVLSALTLDMTISATKAKEAQMSLTKNKGFSGGKISLEVGNADPAEQAEHFYRWFYQERKADGAEDAEYWGRNLRMRSEISTGMIERVRENSRYQKGEMMFGCKDGKPTAMHYDKPEIFKDTAMVVGHHMYGQEETLVEIEMIKDGKLWQIDKINCKK